MNKTYNPECDEHFREENPPEEKTVKDERLTKIAEAIRNLPGDEQVWVGEWSDDERPQPTRLRAFDLCYLIDRLEERDDLLGEAESIELKDGTSRIRMLTKAGALIAAEIDRLQRLEPSGDADKLLTNREVYFLTWLIDKARDVESPPVSPEFLAAIARHMAELERGGVTPTSYRKTESRRATDAAYQSSKPSFSRELKDAIINSPKHVYWGAGEPDSPKDIKAPNGELHTLRCKNCDDPKFPICIPWKEQRL